jgi:hypothetical protein
MPVPLESRETMGSLEEQIQVFARKLAAFTATLSAEEQAMLLTVLNTAPGAEGDVAGFATGAVLQRHRETLMASVLTTIANMKHESLKGIAQNLRG